MNRNAFFPLLLVAALAGVTPGCGPHDHGAHDDPAHEGHAADADHGDHGAHAAHGGHAHHGVDLPASAGPGWTLEDVHFMQMMIGHHDQALRMVALMEGRDPGPELTALSRRIDISQRDEIAVMERWLRERDQAVPDQAQREAMEMPGMVTPAQFEALAAQRGTAFDRLFLELMIEHHVGAIAMVDELFTFVDAAQDSELFQFASDVASDQRDEIGIMERILVSLPRSGR